MKTPTLHRILSMALSRDLWIDHLAGKLSGAFREWCKQKLSEEIGYKGHNWEREVQILIEPIKSYLNGSRKTKSKFQLKPAFIEAAQDTLSSNRLQKAKYLLEEHPLTKAQRMRLEKAVLNEEELFDQMLQKYLHKELTAIKYF